MSIALSLIIGLALITVGGEALIRGAGSTANRLGIPKVVIALTIVAFGTSSPELAVNVSAACRDATDLAFGNIIGSNIANLLLVLGLASLVMPPRVHLDLIRRETPVLLGMHLLLVGLVLDGRLGHLDGVILAVVGLIYMAVLLRAARKARLKMLEEAQGDTQQHKPIWIAVIYMAAGFGGLTLGASWFVDGALEVATLFDLSPRFIGLTLAAIGTSLPELMASLVASLRRQPDLAVGNAIGSCIFNLVFVLGLTSAIHPIDIDLALGTGSGVDLGVAVLASAIVIPILWTGRRVDRWEGALLLGGYIAYITYLFVVTPPA